MERLSKEELRERQLEQQAREQHTLFANVQTAAAPDAEPLVHRHYAQQRLRLEVYEHQVRNQIVVAEQSSWTHNIAHPWRYSDVSIVVQLRAVEESEQTWRAAVHRETSLTMERLFKILNRVFSDAVEQFGREGEETTDMRSLAVEEKELRLRVQEQSLGAAASAVLSTIEPEEKAWRSFIFRAYSEEARLLWSRLLGARFLWLLSPAGGAGGVMSEAESRTRIMRSEWFSRASAAVRFCQLQLQWHEEWQRMTRLFTERLNFHYQRLAFRIISDELFERQALRSVYEPLSIDIREQVEENNQKRKRMENKLTALKNLRSVELSRASAARFESDDYVAVWRARELAEIEALHNQILSSVAAFYTGGQGVRSVEQAQQDNMPVDPLGEALAGRRIRGTVEESPEIQKLRAYASSMSPARERERLEKQQQQEGAAAAASSSPPPSGNNPNLNSVLKLDQALIDLHSHHEDVMQRLATPTTSFDDIVEYRKNLQVKTGPKLSTAAELEVKQLRGLLNAEIAQIQKQSAMRDRRGGSGSVTSFSSGAAVAEALMMGSRHRLPPSTAAAAAAAVPLTTQTLVAQQQQIRGGSSRENSSSAVAAGAAASSAPSPSPVRVQLQAFVRDNNYYYDAAAGLDGDGGSAVGGVYDEDSVMSSGHRQPNAAAVAAPVPVRGGPSSGGGANMSLQSVRDWCLSTARDLSHSP